MQHIHILTFLIKVSRQNMQVTIFHFHVYLLFIFLYFLIWTLRPMDSIKENIAL